MNVIFLIGAVQALFFIALIFNKKEKSPTDGILITWIATLALHVFAVYVLIEGYYNGPFGMVILLIPPLIYTGGPLLLVYTKMITSGLPKFRIVYLLHFIPFFVSIINYLYLYYFEAGKDLEFFMTRPSISPWTGMIFYLLNMFLNPVYVLVVLFVLKDHQKNLRDNFSYTEEINLKWLRVLALGLGFVSIVVWIIHSLIAVGVLERNYEPEFYIFSSVVLYIFVLGYFGFKQGIIYKYSPQRIDSEPHQTEKHKYKKSALTKQQAQNLLEELTNQMEKEESYRNNKLSLNTLAKAINTTPYQLSQLLNTYINKSFFDYVNAYRVVDAEKKISDTAYDHYSLLGIGYDSGFNSKSSFNRIFKQHTGKTPTEYKKTVTN